TGRVANYYEPCVGASARRTVAWRPRRVGRRNIPDHAAGIARSTGMAAHGILKTATAPVASRVQGHFRAVAEQLKSSWSNWNWRLVELPEIPEPLNRPGDSGGHRQRKTQEDRRR